jgi:hypothetical protein
VYSVDGAKPTSVADVAPVQTRFPSLGLTDTRYSRIPESFDD